MPDPPPYPEPTNEDLEREADSLVPLKPTSSPLGRQDDGKIPIADGYQLIYRLMKDEMGRGRNNGLANEHALELIEKYSAALAELAKLKSQANPTPVSVGGEDK
jgi:hypothetical protein